jgi:glycosyltransferase involved in cell wall biosynthesis
MHILLIHQAFTDLDEAGGTRHTELAHYLAGQGHRVTIIASPVSYLSGRSTDRHQRITKTQPVPNLTIHRCYTYQALHRSFVHRTLSFLSFMISSFMTSLKVRQVDVVWGTTPPIFQSATAWLVARLKRARFLLEVRDLWPAFAIAVGVLKNKTLIRASEWLERFLYRHADHVMINSPGFTDHVTARGARQVTLIPNSVDVDMFASVNTSPHFREQHGLKDAFVVIYAGAHGLSNDLNVVLDTANILREEDKIRFVMLGDGKEKPALIQRAARMNLGNVLFVPPVPKQDMPEVLRAADAGLAILKPLELYKTTYPNKVFDYMAAGLPVILAIDGVIRQVVDAAGCGIFVQPGDPQSLAASIRELSIDPDRSRNMGASGRNYVRQYFDRNKSAQKMAGLMEKIES